jgi:threonyl-tRNA synthetase
LKKIQISIDHKKTLHIPSDTQITEVLKTADPGIFQKTVAAVVNHQLVDLQCVLKEDATISAVTTDSAEGMDVFWHSTSHLMAQAIKSLFPQAKFGVGPAVSNGFYYDFELDVPVTPEDLVTIEARMREMSGEDQPFTRSFLSKKEAVALFESRDEPYKIELIRDIPDDSVSIYQCGSFIDLCRGPHVPSTGRIRHFKLLSVAGAYWRGDERNPVMQRIYGVSFPTQEDLDKHLKLLAEAQERDHRRLGKMLDLFSFQLEGPGFPFWHPNGMVIVNEISDFMRETLRRHGYQEIKTPLILNQSLWHRSGHWDHYKENMYFTEIDEGPYAVKPMNCPGGLLVFNNRPHSYRDLPLRLSEMGLVHRHEKSGVLHGLFRVRQFTQDDAHVYCTPDQLEDEILKIIDLIDFVYRTFGFDRYQMELSTRPSKSIGSDDMWENAENALKKALERKSAPYQLNEGEGAFYGPKIDYHVQDSLGRTWQCGTIQVDFSMPERFGLEYTGADGQKHRPVMIHRAILGSMERFIGILIEHVGGAFPCWLAPVQCAVIPISEKHHDFGRKVIQRLMEADIRCEFDDRKEKVGYKIRDSETRKIPYMCVVGDKETAGGTLSVRKRKQGDLGGMTVEGFIETIQEDIKGRKSH